MNSSFTCVSFTWPTVWIVYAVPNGLVCAMPKAKKAKRKAPVTLSVTTVPSEGGSKPTTTRTVIRQFHVLIKRKAQLHKLLSEARSSTADQDAAKKELQATEDDIVRLGGLEAYQRMSNIGQGNDRGGGSERIFVGWLSELSESQRLREEKRQFKYVVSGRIIFLAVSPLTPCDYRLLEVGALRHDNYAPYTTWINNTPIDLRSRHPGILEQDFLRYNEDENRGRWDLISLSLVVNYVPDAKDRGMLESIIFSLILSLTRGCQCRSYVATFARYATCGWILIPCCEQSPAIAIVASVS